MWSRQSTVTSLWCSRVEHPSSGSDWWRKLLPQLGPKSEAASPDPRSIHLDVSRPSTPTGPRAWIRPVLIPTSAPIAAKEQQSMINRMRNHTDKEISREKDKKEKIEPRSNNKTIEKEEKRKWLWQRAIIIQRWSALSSFFYIYFSYFLSNIREIIR